MRDALRRELEPVLRRWWGGELGASGSFLHLLFGPAEWGFRAAVALRNIRYDRAGVARVEGLHVVSVGSLSLGGAGKTPLAGWAARVLAAAGWEVAILSRGYGRDELLLHRHWNPAVSVLADADRVAAAAAARAAGAQAVVLDDGFQHRRLARDVDLVLLAAEDPFGGHLLPRGPFREPVSSLARAHAVVVTRRVAGEARAEALARSVAALFPALSVGRVALIPAGWRRLDGEAAPPPAGPILAVTSVARPHSFAAQVEAETAAPLELLAFPDHHEFTPDDVEVLRERAGDRSVVVTEKDAVKLQRFEATLGDSIRVMMQALSWEAGEADLIRLVTATKEP